MAQRAIVKHIELLAQVLINIKFLETNLFLVNCSKNSLKMHFPFGLLAYIVDLTTLHSLVHLVHHSKIFLSAVYRLKPSLKFNRSKPRKKTAILIFLSI